MIRNYIRTGLRNLEKNKLHSFINIIGLSVGIAVSLLIGLWLWDELSFDKYFQNYDRIAQVMQNVNNNREKNTWSMVPYPLGAELRKSYGGDFRFIVLAAGFGNHILTFNETKLTKSGIYLEKDGPEMLSLKMVKGSREGLKDQSGILISETASKDFFGESDPINKILKIDNKQEVKIVGVYEDLPSNSTFSNLNFIAPWELFFNNSAFIKGLKDPWGPNSFMLYAQLADNAKFNEVSQKIKNATLNNLSAGSTSHKPELFLHPMSKWHLYSDFKNGVNDGGRIQYVWLFGIIGVFVLLLACINFMNLSTAHSEKRAKEVGIRKAIGSLRSQLIFQFFTEALLLVAFAFSAAILLVLISLPLFNEIANKNLSIPRGNPLFWLTGIGFSLITGLIAGSYPALYLSSFQPVKVLKGTFKVGRFAAMPRKIVVVIQFTVSLTLIISTIIVFRQIQFAKNRPIGYNRDGLVTIPMSTNEIHKHFNIVKDELLKSGAIVSVAEAGGSTTEISSTGSEFDWNGKDPSLAVDFPTTDVSSDFGKTISWQFIEGRDFSKEFKNDSLAFIINETAAKYIGLKNPIGETIKWAGIPYKIIGVVHDMIVESPYEPVRPSIFYLSPYPGNDVIAKVNPKVSASLAIEKLRKIFTQFNPAQPFEYKFVDEEYGKKFGSEERVGKLAGFFATLAILISCIGLFGMASVMAERRVKEIGVRKVLGASVFDLWRLLSKDFVVLVVLSLVIAAPVAYYFMHNWLLNYQYRTGIAWWVFATAGLGTMIVTLLTVSFHSIKTAIANPIKSLRTE